MATVDLTEVKGLVEVLSELQEQIEKLQEDRWMGVKDAAEYMRCSPKHVYELSGAGKLVTHKDGSRNVYRRSEIDSYLTNGHGPSA